MPIEGEGPTEEHIDPRGQCTVGARACSPLSQAFLCLSAAIHAMPAAVILLPHRHSHRSSRQRRSQPTRHGAASSIVFLLVVGASCRTTPAPSHSTDLAAAGRGPLYAQLKDAGAPQVAAESSESRGTEASDASVAPDAGHEAPLDADTKAGAVEEALIDSSGQVLPQTTDRPNALAPAFVSRMRILFDAIREDNPSNANSTFFPLMAYRQVKAVARPERDWQYRLVRAFESDIHEYHKKLGRDAAQASLLDVHVHEERARWMKPGTEGNKLGYWRVLRSEMSVRDARGRTLELEITSLISWRGEWYVVHLNGFD